MCGALWANDWAIFSAVNHGVTIPILGNGFGI